MRLAFFFSIFSILYGCMPNQGLSTAAESEINVRNISRLEKGMNQVEVLKIMRQPYSDSVFILDNDTYDVWFYVTIPTALGQSRMVPLNLTPLAFKNGILIGWGKNYYNFLKRWQEKVEEEKLAPKKPIPSEIEQKNIENQELEKVLKESVVPGQPQSKPQALPPKSTPSISPKPTPKKGNRQAPAEPPLNLSPISPQQPAKPSQQQGGTQPQMQPGQAQPSQSAAPNWSPLEEQPRLPQPPPTPAQPPQSPQPPQPAKNVPSQTSMSTRPKTQDGSPNQKNKTKTQEESKVPLTEEDEEMLQEERDQDFNQTECGILH